MSKLLGHSDGRMLETRYAHIDRNVAFMIRTAKKARSPFERRE